MFIQDPGSFSHSGFSGQKSTGSRIRIRITDPDSTILIRNAALLLWESFHFLHTDNSQVSVVLSFSCKISSRFPVCGIQVNTNTYRQVKYCSCSHFRYIFKLFSPFLTTENIPIVCCCLFSKSRLDFPQLFFFGGGGVVNCWGLYAWWNDVCG